MKMCRMNGLAIEKLEALGYQVLCNEKLRYAVVTPDGYVTSIPGHKTLWDIDVAKIAQIPSFIKSDDVVCAEELPAGDWVRVHSYDCAELIATSRMSLEEAIEFLTGPRTKYYDYIVKAAGVYLGKVKGFEDPVVLGTGRALVRMAQDLYVQI